MNLRNNDDSRFIVLTLDILHQFSVKTYIFRQGEFISRMKSISEVENDMNNITMWRGGK